MTNKTIIFSDGSSRGNPGPGGYGAIIKQDDKVFELGGGEQKTTNNRMELMGAIKALESVKSKDNIELHTDSKYLIDGITKWVFNWQKKGWKTAGGKDTDVANRDLWEDLVKATSDKKIKWIYVAGHAEIPGNERCDEIATSFADNVSIKLFKGEASDYEVDLSITEGNVCSPKNTSNKSKAYSYLSVVNGKLEKHLTWPDCEKRVKGVSSARYKKSKNEEDEKQIMKDLGF